MPACPNCKRLFVRLGPHLNNKKKPCGNSSQTLEYLATRVQALTNEISTLRSTLSRLMPAFPTSSPQQPAINSPASLNAISLFSGAGGDTLGLKRAGYSVVAFNEFNEHAIKTHTTVFPDSVRIVNMATGKDDIRNVPDSVFQSYNGKVNVVFAGFPCQGFSHAGKKKTNDSRNELVHEFARVARIIEPKWIIGENVKGLLSRVGKDPHQPADAPLRPVIHIIRDLFERTGYKMTYKVIDTSTIGVPQHRKRLIIVGHRGTNYPHMPWDDLEPASTPSSTSIRAFLEPHLEGAMELPSLYKPSDQPAHYWISTSETAPTGTPHKNLERLVQGIRSRSGKEKKADITAGRTDMPVHIVEPAGLISFGVRKGGYHGMVLNPDVACNTIICTYNLCPRLFVGLHNIVTGKYWIRCMTPRELGQIQGFPADYDWQGPNDAKIAQIGNAVPPPLAERVARSLDSVTFHTTPQATEGATDDPDTDDE